jgi:hypothetical protein
MTRTQYSPDVTVKLSPRVTRKTKRLINQICRRHDMFESDVLRFCLEAIVPQAARIGIPRVTTKASRKKSDVDSMVTVRTSRRIKVLIDNLSQRNRSEYTEAEILRYCYDAILPTAYKEGFAKIMAMREKGL